MIGGMKFAQIAAIIISFIEWAIVSVYERDVQMRGTDQLRALNFQSIAHFNSTFALFLCIIKSRGLSHMFSLKTIQ